MRSFGVGGISCRSESGREPESVADALGSDVKSLTVRGYNTTRFKTQDQVRDYIQAMLAARPPEGNQMANYQAWSEGGSIDVVIMTEWKDRRLGRFELGSLGYGGSGNQYAHVEDHRGCEWWGRFDEALRRR